MSRQATHLCRTKIAPQHVKRRVLFGLAVVNVCLKHEKEPSFAAAARQSARVLPFAPAACSLNHARILENDLKVLRRSG
jgi:hypothetical protein